MTLGTLLCLAALALGQEQKKPVPQGTELGAIGSYAKSIDQFTKRSLRRKRIFANVAGEEEKQDKWRELKSVRQASDQNPYESANVWLRDGKVVVAYFAFTSPSGDWFHYVNYYYRADGTLAKIHSQLNTFYSNKGGLSVVREKFFSVSGKLLHTSTRYLDLESQKSRKRQEFMDEPIPGYKTVRDLPFSKLL